MVNKIFMFEFKTYEYNEKKGEYYENFYVGIFSYVLIRL